ncbi:hypothetical protein PPTG_21098 [Phytophthora nicotianae INRA-310]|uniref:Uncharacterized protein n=1 Tax=Phytophthora nicotianae (strain INRA-310) TaxID=761204 RepID=W2R846_PHYN3|nr:hypothetical protein PPTG_21098 [Phytophthora nicotianae INRA-310]ETN21572.1 hypothetical protein PPTG_21098 [Phytophthora nicotianae INRA-310]
MALNECVGTLMFVKAVAEMDYVKKITDVGSMRYDGAGEKLAFEVSPYAYRYYATNAYHVDTSVRPSI